MRILTGFEHVAAKPKGRDPEQEEAPAQESMRGTRTLLANPSTDEKKTKRRIRRNAADEGVEISEDPIGADLWSTALMIETPPHVAWNPFRRETETPKQPEVGPHGLPMCPHGDAEMKFDTGAEEMYCPTHGRARNVVPRLSQFDYALEARELDATETRTISAAKYDQTLQREAWSDIRYLRNFMQTLNGYGAVVNYITDYGTTSAEGLLHYDGDTATITDRTGRAISIPAHNVLRVEPSEKSEYPSPHDQAGPEADPAGPGFDPVSPIFHGLLPSGATGSLVEADYGTTEHPIEDMPHALERMLSRMPHGHPIPATEPQQQSLTPTHQKMLRGEAVQHESWNPFRKKEEPKPTSGSYYDDAPEGGWGMIDIDPEPAYTRKFNEQPEGPHPGDNFGDPARMSDEEWERQEHRTFPTHSSLEAIQAANAAHLAALRGTGVRNADAY